MAAFAPSRKYSKDLSIETNVLIAAARTRSRSALGFPRMQNLEDTEAVGRFSAPVPFGNAYFSRFLDVVKTGGVLETEIEVLDHSPGIVLSELLSMPC